MVIAIARMPRLIADADQDVTVLAPLWSPRWPMDGNIPVVAVIHGEADFRPDLTVEDARAGRDHRVDHLAQGLKPLLRDWLAVHHRRIAGESEGFGEHRQVRRVERSEEHTSELQSLMRNSYAV